MNSSIRIMYVVEAMIGSGPNDDAKLIAQAVATDFPQVEILVLSDSLQELSVASDRVTWIPLAPWRTNPRHFQLLDSSGRNLPDREIDVRREAILRAYENFKPHIIILHNFLSGEKWDELLTYSYLPLVARAQSEANPPVLISFLLGMLDSFEKYSEEESRRYEQYVRRSVDKIFLRSDSVPNFIATCPPACRFQDLLLPVGYTAPKWRPSYLEERHPREIVISGGGGDEASHLYHAAIEACALAHEVNSPLAEYLWRVLVGPLGEKFLPQLRELAYTKLRLTSLQIQVQSAISSEDFVKHLYRSAVVSISQCGQRTFSDLEVSGVPAVIVPRESDGTEQEQLYRARYMEEHGRSVTVREAELTPDLLLRSIPRALTQPVNRLGVNLEGAHNVIQASIDLVANSSRKAFHISALSA